MRGVKVAAFAVLAGIVLAPAARADTPGLESRDLLIRADWQDPGQLPSRFRNHCAVENFTARPYCSNHCGGDYQFYYCSEQSFGCCHLGHGYCDWDGLLRCHP
jgi:hypothetical protein